MGERLCVKVNVPGLKMGFCTDGSGRFHGHNGPFGQSVTPIPEWRGRPVLNDTVLGNIASNVNGSGYMTLGEFSLLTTGVKGSVTSDGRINSINGDVTTNTLLKEVDAGCARNGGHYAGSKRIVGGRDVDPDEVACQIVKGEMADRGLRTQQR